MVTDIGCDRAPEAALRGRESWSVQRGRLRCGGSLRVVLYDLKMLLPCSRGAVEFFVQKVHLILGALIIRIGFGAYLCIIIEVESYH